MHRKGRLAAALFWRSRGALLADTHEAVLALEQGAWLADEATAGRIALTAHRITLLRSTAIAIVVIGVGAAIAVVVVAIGIAVVIRVRIIGVWSGAERGRGDGSGGADRAAHHTGGDIGGPEAGIIAAVPAVVPTGVAVPIGPLDHPALIVSGVGISSSLVLAI